MIDLQVEHVSKRYRIRQEETASVPQDTLMGRLRRLRPPRRDFWALRDVSFEVRRGESLGIIGANGAGKSTILKLLSNITTPTSGEITINGRLSALIEVGSGFHPELTGRENIFLSGSILGMRRREIAAKLESIVEFAGLSQFLDVPVKRYSSGMYVRLGFSIAAHLEPDILLLDEVLAVGDASFQAKCLDRIKELERAGTTIVFISHDLTAVERVCDRAILLQQGEIVASGAPSEVIKRYSPMSSSKLSEGLRFVNPALNPSNDFEVERVEALDRDGNLKQTLGTGEYVRFRIVWRSTKVVEYGGVELGLYAPNGTPLIRYSSQPVSGFDVEFHPGSNSIDLEFEQFPLTAGEYRLGVGLTIPRIEWLYRNDHFGLLEVSEKDMFQTGYCLDATYSMLSVPHQWHSTQSDGRS
jgi:lipopolysaccharide transport system ATP-binding protein